MLTFLIDIDSMNTFGVLYGCNVIFCFHYIVDDVGTTFRKILR